MQTLIRLYLVLALLFAYPARAEETVELPGSPDYVEEILPYPVDVVHDRALLLFNSEARDYYEDYPSAIYDLPADIRSAHDLNERDYQRFLSFPLVRTYKFYVFLGAYPAKQSVINRLDAMSVMGQSNAALQRYAALPVSARQNDIYLWSPDMPYWKSEYVVNGRTVPFHSYFLLHLTPVDTQHTRLEVIEMEPTVELGRKLNVDVHGEVHHFDIRNAEPTAGDRKFVISCVRQFIERNVPGRHFFNCRAPGEPEPEKPVPFTVP